MFGYRSGTYPVTAKALRKLEAAEQAVGIQISQAPNVPGSVVRDGEVEYRATSRPWKSPTADNPFPLSSEISRLLQITSDVQTELVALKTQIAEFPMMDLVRHMEAAKAWPPSPEDGKLTPAALWKKYAPKP